MSIEDGYDALRLAWRIIADMERRQAAAGLNIDKSGGDIRITS
ncbi:MAG TPA: hypothetical protein PK198_00350 [Saprospiraceae bacterium]|nr:hypothetical protein [Saprospiraceae bacterium]